jgi:hypothetical protein
MAFQPDGASLPTLEPRRTVPRILVFEFAGGPLEAIRLTLGCGVSFLHRMASPDDTPEPYYIAFIDEAGDPGLTRVRPRDPNGSSEWLVLGATVIRAETEPHVVEWVRTIRKEIRATQGPDRHFRGSRMNVSAQFASWSPP